MNRATQVLSLAVLVLWYVDYAWPTETHFTTLVDSGKPTCTLAIADEPAFMEEKAAAEIVRVILRDSNAKVTTRRVSQIGSSPVGNFVLLGTPQSVPLIGNLSRELPEGVGDLPLVGPDGYAVQTLKRGEANYLIIGGATPRAVFYGAVYAGEQVLQLQAGNTITTAETKITRVPAMAVRAPYTLGFCGSQPEYTTDDWKVVLDGMARESINCVYYWWQSLYKPRAFPDRRNIDGGVDRIRMTNADVNELARYAHKLGMKFLLGGGAFAWGGAAALTDVYPETAANGVSGMCPSHPKARELQISFSLEMLEEIPEADGIWFEPRDEHGECKCHVCQKPMDAYGSEQYGQSEIVFLKQFSKALWARRPDANVAWLIELSKRSKMHSEDPAYFEKISQIKDPRIQWVVVWGAWEFPGPRGEYRPNTFVSRQHVWWSKPYIMTLESMRTEVLKASDRGMLGFSPAFEMCFSVDYHGAAIPYPMDQLPYELTSYAFREFCWDPAQTMDEFKAKMKRRYFGPEGSAQLVDDLIALRRFAIAGNWNANRSTLLTKMAGEFIYYDGKPLPKQDVEGTFELIKTYNDSDKKITLGRLEKNLRQLREIVTDDMPKMLAIEARLNQAEPTANRRTKATIVMMRRFIDNTKRLLDKIDMNPGQIDEALKLVAAANSGE